MPINDSIFANPEAAEGQYGNSDVVGRFRSGYQASNRPVALKEWRVTTGDPDVAEKLVELLEAKDGYDEWDTKTDEVFQVFGSKSAVDIILDNAGGVRSSFVLWGRKGKIRECDGTYLIEEGRVTDEPCPSCSTLTSMQERREAFEKGTGCGPSLQIYFRLAEAPDMGKFKFFSGSWTAIQGFSKAEKKLKEIDGPARARLELEVIEGKQRTFTKPKVTVLGPVED